MQATKGKSGAAYACIVVDALKQLDLSFIDIDISLFLAFKKILFLKTQSSNVVVAMLVSLYSYA